MLICMMWFVCVWNMLTNLRPFVGELYGYDFVNKLCNSNQSCGVAFFVRACHSYEVVES